MKAPLFHVVSAQSIEKKGEQALPKNYFQETLQDQLVQELLRMERANRRQGSHKVKVRHEVQGGGRKPWKQKGTGNARAGSIRAGQWRGGGVIHGPMPRSYRIGMPRKARRKAYAALLSQHAKKGTIKILENFPVEQFKKTRELNDVLLALGVAYQHDGQSPATLIMNTDHSEIKRLLGNLSQIIFMNVKRLNAPEIWASQQILITQDALEYFASLKIGGERAKEEGLKNNSQET